MRVPGLRLNRCRTQMSTIHGMGVFATRDIKKGDLVTLYPGDAVFYWVRITECGRGSLSPLRKKGEVYQVGHGVETLDPRP